MADVVASFRARSLPVLLGGAHVRASNGTDTGLDGTLSTVSSNVPAFDRDRGVVLEAGATNVCLYSERFHVDPWGRGFLTVVADQISAPNGAIGAARVVESVTTGIKNLVTPVFSATSGVYYTASIFIKRGSGATAPDIVQIAGGSTAFGAGKYANFNISEGAVTRVEGGSAAVTAFGDGWFRLAYTCTANTTTANGAFNLPAFCNNVPGSGRTPSYSGLTTSDFYVWGAMIEANTFATSYIPTTSAAVLRQPSYILSTLSALGVASQAIGYTLAGVVQFPFAKGVPPESYPRLMGVGATAASDRFEITYNPNTGRIYAGVLQAGSSIGECSTTAGELDWAAEETVFFAASWGTADGLILVTRKPDGTTYVDTNTGAALKTALANPMTHAAIQGHIVTGAWSDTGGTATWRGALIADRAYSQAELEALDATMFDPVVTLDGITYPATVTGSNQVSITVAGIGEFDAAGDHVATPFYENVPVTLAIGDESASSTLQVVAPVPDNFGTAGASPVYPPVGLDIGDDVYVDKVSGTGSADPEGVNYIAATASVVRFRAFDQNSGLWLAYREELIPASSGERRYRVYVGISVGV